jgi:carboxylesterase type B
MPTPMEELLNGLSSVQASATGVRSQIIADEFECLNLVITTPVGVNDDSTLPVLVVIHGGGNTTGANLHWFLDGVNLVVASVKADKPVVMVSIKYVK